MTSIVESDAFDKAFLSPGRSSVAPEGVVHRSGSSSGKNNPAVESVGPASCEELPSWSGDVSASRMEVIVRLV